MNHVLAEGANTPNGAALSTAETIVAWLIRGGWVDEIEGGSAAEALRDNLAEGPVTIALTAARADEQGRIITTAQVERDAAFAEMHQRELHHFETEQENATLRAEVANVRAHRPLCSGCDGTATSCVTSRIKCCPDCDHSASTLIPAARAEVTALREEALVDALRTFPDCTGCFEPGHHCGDSVCAARDRVRAALTTEADRG